MLCTRSVLNAPQLGSGAGVGALCTIPATLSTRSQHTPGRNRGFGAGAGQPRAPATRHRPHPLPSLPPFTEPPAKQGCGRAAPLEGGSNAAQFMTRGTSTTSAQKPALHRGRDVLTKYMAGFASSVPCDTSLDRGHGHNASAAGGIRTHMPVRTAPFEDAMYTVPSPPRWRPSLRPPPGRAARQTTIAGARHSSATAYATNRPSSSISAAGATTTPAGSPPVAGISRTSSPARRAISDPAATSQRCTPRS